MMDGKQFGALALQLIEQSQVPGNALDTAVAFRGMARALAEGRIVTRFPAPEPVAPQRADSFVTHDAYLDPANLPKAGAGGVE